MCNIAAWKELRGIESAICRRAVNAIRPRSSAAAAAVVANLLLRDWNWVSPGERAECTRDGKQFARQPDNTPLLRRATQCADCAMLICLFAFKTHITTHTYLCEHTYTCMSSTRSTSTVPSLISASFRKRRREILRQSHPHVSLPSSSSSSHAVPFSYPIASVYADAHTTRTLQYNGLPGQSNKRC